MVYYVHNLLISLKHYNSTRETSTHRRSPPTRPDPVGFWTLGQSHSWLISSTSSSAYFHFHFLSSFFSSFIPFPFYISLSSPLHLLPPLQSLQCLTAFSFPNPAFRARTPSIPNPGDVCCKAEQLQPVTRQIHSTLLLLASYCACTWTRACTCACIPHYITPAPPLLYLLPLLLFPNMTFREKVKRVFHRSSASQDTGRPKVEYYRRHEVPPSKFRGPFDKEHQKRLAAWSFDRAMVERPRSLDLALSPCATYNLPGPIDSDASEEIAPDDDGVEIVDPGMYLTQPSTYIYSTNTPSHPPLNPQLTPSLPQLPTRKNNRRTSSILAPPTQTVLNLLPSSMTVIVAR